jgi:hypothetical protein
MKNIWKQLIEILQIEIEYPITIKEKLINSLSWGIKVFLVLFILRPFGISDNSIFAFFYTCSGYGVITIIIFFINNISTKSFIINLLDKKWNVSIEMMYTFILFPQISILNYMFYMHLDCTESFSVSRLLVISFYTLIIFIILEVAGIIYKLVYSYKKESVVLKTRNDYYIEINKLKNILDTAKEEILLNFEDGQIGLQRDSITMINAWGNYIKIYIKVNNEVVQIVRRGKMKNTIMELRKHTEFVQCHRSFILNMKYVNTIIGNNKKAYAIIKPGNLKASISRENITTMRELFEKLQKQKLTLSNS